MLDKEYYQETYKLFQDTYGEDFELRLAIEEMSELTKAICKYLRMKNAGEYEDKQEEIRQCVIEECADVLICAEQIKRIFGDAKVEEVMDYKIQRGRKRNEERLKQIAKK